MPPLTSDRPGSDACRHLHEAGRAEAVIASHRQPGTRGLIDLNLRTPARAVVDAAPERPPAALAGQLPHPNRTTWWSATGRKPIRS
jgi:hypothetical protein